MSPAVRGWIRAATLGAAVFVFDQATKQLAASRIAPGEQVDVLLGFQLTDVRNEGIAFGLFGGGQALVIVITLAALALVLGYFAIDPTRPWLWIGIGLLGGGALGNLADRLRDGSVIDFLDPPGWPSFNLADIAIVAGIAAILLVQMRTDREPAARPET